MNMLETDCSLFSVLLTDWSSAIGPDHPRYWALIGGTYYAGAIKTHLKVNNFVHFGVSLWNDKCPLHSKNPGAIKTQ